MSKEDAIATYTPQLSPETWAGAETFVRETVRAHAATRSIHWVKSALTFLAWFADWVVATGIGEVGPSVLRADVIDAYTAHRATEVSPAVAERERKTLRVLAGLGVAVERRSVTTRTPTTTPYPLCDQDVLRRWAATQPTESRRRAFTTLLALGLGCGLTAPEIMAVRGRDIVMLDDGMPAARVAGRTVPVTSEWADELSAARTTPALTYLVGPGYAARNARSLSALVTQPAPPVHLTAQRMRATWMVGLLNSGLPVPTLLEAAGLTSPDVLRRLITHLDAPSGEARLTALRGGAR